MNKSMKTLNKFVILLVIFSFLFDGSIFASGFQTTVHQNQHANLSFCEYDTIKVERGEESARVFSAKSFSLPYAMVYIDNGLKLKDNEIQTLLVDIYTDLKILVEDFTKDYYKEPIEIWILQFNIEQGTGFEFSYEDLHGRIITNERLINTKDYLRPVIEKLLDCRIPVLSYGLVSHFNKHNSNSKQVQVDAENASYNVLSFFPLYFHQEYVGAEVAENAYVLANDFISFLLQSMPESEMIKLFVENSPSIKEKQEKWYRDIGISEPPCQMWRDIRLNISDPTYDITLETEVLSYSIKKNFLHCNEMSEDQLKLRDLGFYSLSDPSDIESFVDTNLKMFKQVMHKLENIKQVDALLSDSIKISYFVSEATAMQQFYDSTTDLGEDNKRVINLGSPIYYAHIHELIHAILNPVAILSWGKEMKEADLQRYLYLSEGLACFLSTQINLEYIEEYPEHSNEIDKFYNTDPIRDSFLKFDNKHVQNNTFEYSVYKNYIQNGGVVLPNIPLDYSLLEHAKVVSAFAEDPKLEDDRFIYLYYESWMNYMTDRYGLLPVIEAFLSNADFHEAFGMSFEESLTRWKTYVRKGIR